METIKKKLSYLKEQIDEAEEREADAKNLLKDALAREEFYVSEAEGTKRRLRLLENDFSKVKLRIVQQEEKLQEVAEKGENEEQARKVLEESELEGDEKLTELEESLAEAEKKREEAIHLLNEAKRRLLVIQNDLNTARNREDICNKRVESLAQSLEKLGSRTKDLEKRDEVASEREQTTEEKFLFLEEQLKEATTRGDGYERQWQGLQRTADSTVLEIELWKGKTQDLKDEMENITCIADEMWTILLVICISKTLHVQVYFDGTRMDANFHLRDKNCKEKFELISDLSGTSIQIWSSSNIKHFYFDRSVFFVMSWSRS